MIRLSLAICTYNRSDVLPRCLRAALAQTIPPEEYEILIVDNASTDSTAQIADRFHRSAPRHRIRYIRHPVQGLSHGRNRGLTEAASGIVHYIDDDAVADPGLIANILAVFDRHQEAAVVGGEIRAVFPDSLPEWFSAYFRGYYSELVLNVAEPVEINEMSMFPYGANIGYRKDALLAAGMFNTKIGRIGRDFSGGEELDASYRIWLKKGKVFYTPHAKVEHLILPARIHWEHIASSAAAAGRNWAYYECELFGKRGGLRVDFDHWREARRQMAEARRQPSVTAYHEALSRKIFYGAKLKRMLEYRLR